MNSTRRFGFLACVLTGLALAPSLLARAADAPAKPELPKPPTTPLPKFENPLHDCEVGETCFYAVHELEKKDGWVRWFEERVLARTATRALVETIETDETDTKEFGIDGASSGWRPIPAEFPTPPGHAWFRDKAKDEVIYVGDPPTVAVRATHRWLEEPVTPGNVDGPKRMRQIWYSHDVAATGRVKMFPAQRGGERLAISWSKKLPMAECAKRAGRYRDEEAAKPAPEPGMGEGGMEEPAMGEGGMSEPGMEEPGMGEASMDDKPAMGASSGRHS